MKVTRTSGPFGMEVEKVQLAQLGRADLATLKELLFSVGLLIFRGQHDLTPTGQTEFALRWGEPNVNRFFQQVEDFAHIAQIRKEPHETVNVGEGWHTDHSYDLIPAMGSILRAVVLPPAGLGDTLFVNTQMAYSALDSTTRAEIADCRAHHSSRHIFGPDAPTRSGTQGRVGNAQAAVQDVLHRVVIEHPVTGSPGLYVNPAFTRSIVGMGEPRSRLLLQRLYSHCQSDRFVTCLSWQPGTVAMWDNRLTWHRAVNNYHGYSRLMHRITIAGEPLAGSRPLPS